MKKYKIKKIKLLGDFLKLRFGIPYGEYLEEMHDERTIYVHPYNQLLDHWCPPWDADTCYDTLDVVKELLVFYLTGKYASPKDNVFYPITITREEIEKRTKAITEEGSKLKKYDK